MALEKGRMLFSTYEANFHALLSYVTQLVNIKEKRTTCLSTIYILCCRYYWYSWPQLVKVSMRLLTM